MPRKTLTDLSIMERERMLDAKDEMAGMYDAIEGKEAQSKCPAYMRGYQMAMASKAA